MTAGRVIAVLFVLILSGCAQPPDNTVVIGVPTILSGDFAVLGTNVVRSAEIAINQTPHPGYTIRLVPEDIGCGGKGLIGASKLVDVDGAVAIIGATCSDDTMAAAPFVNERKIPYITPVTGGSNIDDAGEYIFRMGNADIQAGIQPAEDFMQRLNYKKVAVLTEQREYTLDISSHFTPRFTELGGEIVFDETFAPGESDFRTTITKIKAANPDAILFLSQLGTTGGHFIKQASEQGLDARIVTTFTTATNPDAATIAGDSINGVYFYDPLYDKDSDEYQAFLAEYKARFSAEPAIPFHAAATYDTTQLIIQAINEVGPDGQKIHDWLLANVQNHHGLMGEYSFDAQGNTDLGFELKEVQNGQFVLVE